MRTRYSWADAQALEGAIVRTQVLLQVHGGVIDERGIIDVFWSQSMAVAVVGEQRAAGELLHQRHPHRTVATRSSHVALRRLPTLSPLPYARSSLAALLT